MSEQVYKIIVITINDHLQPRKSPLYKLINLYKLMSGPCVKMLRIQHETVLTGSTPDQIALWNCPCFMYLIKLEKLQMQ